MGTSLQKSKSPPGRIPGWESAHLGVRGVPTERAKMFPKNLDSRVISALKACVPKWGRDILEYSSPSSPTRALKQVFLI